MWLPEEKVSFQGKSIKLGLDSFNLLADGETQLDTAICPQGHS